MTPVKAIRVGVGLIRKYHIRMYFKLAFQTPFLLIFGLFGITNDAVLHDFDSKTKLVSA